MEKFKIWIKKNWQVCVIILLTMMFMSKCTSSCTNKQKVNLQAGEIEVLDKVIMDYQDSIKYLNITIDNLNEQLSAERYHTNSYENIATGNQKELLLKIEKLSKENKALLQKNKQLEIDIDKLRQ